MFDGTTESLTEMAIDLPIQHWECLAAYLQLYETQMETGDTPDSTLLEKAQQVVLQRLEASEPLDQEFIHLATLLGYYRDEWAPLLPHLNTYRHQSLDRYEIAWAWWHHIDYLALLRQNSRVVEEQEAFFTWAQQHLPSDHWLFVWNDSTQGACWLECGEGESWFTHCTHLLHQTLPIAANRYDRFLLLRSMFDLLIRHERIEEARQILQRLHQLEQEDPSWERAAELHLQIVALQISFPEQSHREHMHALATTAIQGLEAYKKHMHTPQQRRIMRRLAHNIGAELFFARQYELAIPFFEEAAQANSMSLHTYLWLAASLWMLKKNAEKPRILSYLHQARMRFGSALLQRHMQNVPELAAFQKSLTMSN